MRLPDGKDFYMRPVVENMCLYSELKDGSLDLWDVADMNDALDARDENARRAATADRR